MPHILKNKKIILASWSCEIPDYYQNRDWIPILKKLFGKVIIFSPRTNYFCYGKKKMNKMFLDLIKKEQPDFLLLSLSYDEFFLDTLEKIKAVSPRTKSLNLFGDDDWRYDDWTRYYALFIDALGHTEKDYSEYKKDGFLNTVFFHGINPESIKHLNLNKEYDVVFVGMPVADRYDYIKFLKESGVNIRLFGLGWEKYDDLKSIYGGFLNTKDLIEVYNKTKINLNFSKGALPGSKKGQLKGRILEIPASQNFILIEEFPSLKYIYPNYYKKICFKDKNELLKKIEYFLKNEEERENIAKGLRKQVIDNYSWESQIESIFTKIAFGDKKLIRKDFPRSGKRIVILSESDLKLDFLELNKKIKEFDYIMLNSNDSVSLKWRNYIQSYSLEKSGKDISCCDYYVSNKILGDYLLFTAKKAFYNIPRKDFNEMLTIGQIMVKKDFFLRNIDKFKDKKIDFVNENNTIFVSIPLIKLNNIKYKSEYNIMSKAFKAKFIDNIYSLIYQKKIIYNGYIYKLVAHSLLYGENFVLFHLYKSILNKENFNKIKKWLL